MQLKAILVAAFLSLTCSAQDVYSVYSRLAPASPSSGNGAQVGIGFDAVVQPGKHFMFDVDVSAVREAKAYVGDGWSIRAQGEGLIGARWFWFGGGLATARHSNSQYTKSQYQPIVSVHYRPNPLVDVYGSYLFPASGNDNNVKGYRVGYRGAFAQPGKWGAFVQVEYTRFGFTTAFNERLKAGSFVTGIGISRNVKNFR